MTSALSEIELDLPRVGSGKVRELFDAGEHLVLVASDRISIYDVVLPTPIPGKGEILTRLSAFWFDLTRNIVPNHMVSLGYEGVGDRAMVCRKAEMLPVEWVVRGYLAGSGWSDYKRTGSVCGVDLPAGLREGERLPEPIFTPATKAEEGHDENISLDQAAALIGDRAMADQARRASIALYERAADHSAGRGIILADTKLEFGVVDGRLTLCDEAFTPDSSRFWPADGWEPGRTPPSFDKQYVRDFADSIGWDRNPPGPQLPADVVKGTTDRYREALERLTG